MDWVSVLVNRVSVLMDRILGLGICPNGWDSLLMDWVSVLVNRVSVLMGLG